MGRWSIEWNKAEREVPEIVLDFQGLLHRGLISFARGSRPIIGLVMRVRERQVL